MLFKNVGFNLHNFVSDCISKNKAKNSNLHKNIHNF